MTPNVVIVTAITLLFADVSYGRSNGSHEHELRAKLLSRYDRVVRPPNANNTPITVHFGLKLNRLVKVNIKEQTIVVDTWIVMKWKNSFFNWDKSKYGGTDKIGFEPTGIWFPDVSLYNNADSETPRAGGPAVFISNVVVDNTGMNVWSGPATFIASCSMALNSWPFDHQSCELRFGSFSYGSHQLQLTVFKNAKDKADNFQESGNWQVSSSLVVKIGEADFGNCCQFKFSEISFRMMMTRRYRYHLFYLVAPCIALSFLTLIGFCIPSDSGERIGFTTTLMLGMMVFLLVVPESLPESSESLPVLGILMMTTMVMIGFALMATIFVLRCHHSTGTPPGYLRCLVKCCKRKTAPRSEMLDPGIEIKVVRPVEEPTCEPRKDVNTEFTWQNIATTLDMIFFWLFFVSSVVLYAVCLTFRS